MKGGFNNEGKQLSKQWSIKGSERNGTKLRGFSMKIMEPHELQYRIICYAKR